MTIAFLKDSASRAGWKGGDAPMKYQADASPQRFPIPKLTILLDLESDRELLVLYVTSAFMKSSGWNSFVGQGLFLASDGNLYNASKGPLRVLRLLADGVDCRKWNGLATIEMPARYLETILILSFLMMCNDTLATSAQYMMHLSTCAISKASYFLTKKGLCVGCVHAFLKGRVSRS